MRTSTRESALPVTFFFGARQKQSFQLSPEDSHHAVRVLRHAPGDLIWCIDGTGSAFEVVIVEADVRAAVGTIEREHPAFNEPGGRIELLCGMTQPARLDWVVEKGTELGLHELRPIVGPTPAGPGRVRRWSRIARGAAKQCRRGYVPLIHEPQALEAHLAQLGPGGRRLCADVSGAPLDPGESREERLILAVGHDSGFSNSELTLLQKAGFLPVSLGERRLRTETAVVALLARIQAGS